LSTGTLPVSAANTARSIEGLKPAASSAFLAAVVQDEDITSYGLSFSRMNARIAAWSWAGVVLSLTRSTSRFRSSLAM
jgi:hypothetical protein